MKFYIHYSSESNHAWVYYRYISREADDMPLYYEPNGPYYEVYEIDIPDDADVFDFMQRRESSSYLAAEQGHIPWIKDMKYDVFVKGTRLHMPRPAVTDPSKVVYYQSAEHLVAGRLSTIKPGKYLQKYYGHILSGDQIQAYAERWRKLHSTEKNELQFANTPLEFKAVYTMQASFNSCMQKDATIPAHSSTKNHEVRIYHPTEVYAAGDLELAYIVRDDVLVARALIWRDAPTPGTESWYVDADGNRDDSRHVRVGRVYGDSVRLQRALLSIGIYTNSTNSDYDAMDGARLLRIPYNITKQYNSVSYIAPYIDGSARYIKPHESPDFFTLDTRSRGAIPCTNTCGYVDTYVCDYSGMITGDSDDLIPVTDKADNIVGRIYRGVRNPSDYGIYVYDGCYYDYKPAMRIVKDRYGRDCEVLDNPRYYFTSITGVEYDNSVLHYNIRNSSNKIAGIEMEAQGYISDHGGFAILASEAVRIGHDYWLRSHAEERFFYDDMTDTFNGIMAVLESANADLFGDKRYFANRHAFIAAYFGELEYIANESYIVLTPAQASALGEMGVYAQRGGSNYVVRKSYMKDIIFNTARDANKIFEIFGRPERFLAIHERG